MKRRSTTWYWVGLQRTCWDPQLRPADKRVAYAHLTHRGWRLIKRIAPHHVETVRAMMIDLLSPAEVKARGNAFEKISSHLRKCV